MENNQSVNQASVDQALQYAAFQDIELSKKEIADRLHKDIVGMHILLSEILKSEDIQEALSEVLYQKYVRIKRKVDAGKLSVSKS